VHITRFARTRLPPADSTQIPSGVHASYAFMLRNIALKRVEEADFNTDKPFSGPRLDNHRSDSGVAPLASRRYNREPKHVRYIRAE